MTKPGDENPYQAPDSPARLALPTNAVEVAPCYRCQSRYATRVGFTWWGGFEGAWLLSHVRCIRCNTEFNAKTGLPNTTAIVIYVCTAAAFGAFALIAGIAALVYFA